MEEAVQLAITIENAVIHKTKDGARSVFVTESKKVLIATRRATTPVTVANHHAAEVANRQEDGAAHLGTSESEAVMGETNARTEELTQVRGGLDIYITPEADHSGKPESTTQKSRVRPRDPGRRAAKTSRNSDNSNSLRARIITDSRN
jgi:hypothetical protein